MGLIRVVFGARYLHPCPKEFEELAKMVQEKTLPGLKFPLLSAAEKVLFLKSLDYLRRPERFENWLLAAANVFPHFPVECFESATDLLRQVDRQNIAVNCSNPADINKQIFAAECAALQTD